MKQKAASERKNDSILSYAGMKMREMGLNVLTLSFPSETEKAFIDFYYANSLKQLRFYLGLAIVFFMLFGLLDVLMIPGVPVELWSIRYGFICPGLILCLLVSFTRFFKKFMQPTLTFFMLLTGVGIIMMIAVADQPVSYSYYAGLICVLMYGYTFIRIRFVWATLAGWLLVAMYEMVAVLVCKTPYLILVNNSFFFISANIIGMLACYSIEYYARRDFLMARLLEEEQNKVMAANLALEHRVEERTAQLLQANKDLQLEMEERQRAEHSLIQAQKMEAIGTLAGGIAHDFNNILTAIMGYAEIGLYKKNLKPEKIKYSFQQIFQAGGRAKDLIKQILTFSRREEQEQVPVHVGSIVKEAVKLIEATISKAIEIRLDIRCESDLVLADPTQVHQVVLNLCTNAAHAMKENGGSMHIVLDELPERTGQVADLQGDAFLELSVRDTGVGMQSGLIDRIFNPFFSTKGKDEGSGMGLSVAHGIVKSCGGKISVESEPGKGSCFHVYLPMIERVEDARVEGEVQLPSGTETILFVDDEPQLVDVSREMLEEFGYTVTVSTDALHALETFRSNPEQFDLVITDKVMPCMNGFDLARELFQIKPTIPVILCSGIDDPEDVAVAKSIGVKELIVKPFVMHEVAETIRYVLDHRM